MTGLYTEKIACRLDRQVVGWYATTLCMWQSIVSLLYPPACLLCHRRIDDTSAVFCQACERAMQPLLPPVCQRCGVGLSGAYDATALCQRCQKRPLAFDRARAPFVYVGAIREAIHAFKYGGHRRIGVWLASHMARVASALLPVSEIQAAVPVPMHWAKRRLKGAHPAALLARTVAELLHVPCELDGLQRTRWTPTQTRLTARQRFRNVQGTFRMTRPLRSDGTILLIDDVLTSGATAHACALALRTAGVRTVSVLTAACAPLP